MHALPSVLAMLVVVPVLVAQDEPSFGRQTERLRRACAKMSSLGSVAAVTRTETKSAQAVAAPFGQPRPASEVRVVVADGVLHARIGEEDRIAMAGRGAIARRGDGEWALRKDRDWGGVPLPFVLDPTRFFRALSDLEPTVCHADVGEADGRPVEIYSVALDPEDAGELTWAGLLPAPTGLAFAFGMFGGGGARTLPKPSLRTDLAFAIDPATEHVVELRAQMFEREPFAAQGAAIQVRVGQDGVVQIETPKPDEEEVPADDLEYRDGLPVRELAEHETRRSLNVTFRDFGTAALPELGAEGRRLLGLPPVESPADAEPR